MDEQQLDVNDVVGSIGRYHIIVLSLSVLRAMPMAWTLFTSPLMAPDVPHKCAPPDGVNRTLWEAFATPMKCSALPLISIYDGRSFHKANASVQQVPCEHGWDYDMELFGITATSEWNLVCDNAWKRSAIQSVVMTGSLCGVLIIGKISDTFGRKPTFFTAAVIASLAGVSGAFASSLMWFNICRFILAASMSGLTAAILSLLMEIMPKNGRVLGLVAFGIAFVIPITVLGLVSWTVGDFRNIQLLLGVILAVLLPFYPFIHESPKWLLSKRKIPQAMQSIRLILARNKRTVPDLGDKMILLAKPFANRKDNTSLSIFNLGKSKTLTIHCAAIFMLWFLEPLCYYHIALNAHTTNGENPHLKYVLSASAEIPACLVSMWVCGRFKHRISQTSALLAALFSYVVAVAIISKDAVWTIVIAMMFVRFFLKISNSAQWIAVNELFPTSIRSTGFAICLTCTRIGGVISPFLIDLGRDVHFMLPHIIFTVAVIVAIICIGILPETFGRPLPDSMEDLENVIRSTRLFKPERSRKPISRNVLL